MYRTTGLQVFGTTYTKFASMFGLKPEKGYDNKSFIKTLSSDKVLIKLLENIIHLFMKVCQRFQISKKN